MKRHVFFICLAALPAVLISSPCKATVYSWKDAAGNTHYTNKDYEIPDRFRSKAKVLYPDPVEGAQSQQGFAAEQQRQVLPSQQSIPPQPPLEAVSQLKATQITPPEQIQYRERSRKSGKKRNAVKED